MLDLEYAPAPPFLGGTEASTAPRTTAWLRAMYDRDVDAAKASLQPGLAAANPAADLVCGMALSAGPHPTVSYQGHTYRFCSATCQAAFKRDPTHYVGR